MTPITANDQKSSYISIYLLKELIDYAKTTNRERHSGTSEKNGEVLEQEQFDLLNVQLRAGEEIPAHSVNNTAIAIVRKGDVVFNVEGEKVA